MSKNKIKLNFLMESFEQITYRKLNDKFIISVWIPVSKIEELVAIMGCGFFGYEKHQECYIVHNCIFIEDFTPFLNHVGYTDEEVNKIREEYAE